MTNCADTLKQDFNITESLSDVKFTGYTKKPYQNEAKEAAFGEKLCILYSIECSAYRVEYKLKILAFAYEKFHEILKLEITVKDGKFEKELAPCRNFLQRHRNLNATFRTLVQFSKFFETRRLIAATVLSKQAKIEMNTNEEGSLQVKYYSYLSKILITLTWKIEWNIKECEFLDLIEVYYNDFELPTTDVIKETLTALTHHSLDFHTKFKLWRLLMTDLDKSEEYVRQTQKTMSRTRCNAVSDTESIVVVLDKSEKPMRQVQKTSRTGHKVLSDTESVVVLSDSEEDGGTFSVNRKRRRAEPLQSCDSSVIFVPD